MKWSPFIPFMTQFSASLLHAQPFLDPGHCGHGLLRQFGAACASRAHLQQRRKELGEGTQRQIGALCQFEASNGRNSRPETHHKFLEVMIIDDFWAKKRWWDGG
jgi:hypothetical protein